MDDIVLRGMAKWPAVPAVYGWLSRDRRGNWLLKGERISNPALIGFIERNYAQDDRGRWYFQNGPQRVYVTLEYTPMVYRASCATDGSLELTASNDKRPAAVRDVYLDEEGALLFESDLGLGVLHDQDLDVALQALRDARGDPLNDDAMEEQLHRLCAGTSVPLFLRIGGRLLQVHPVKSHDVARQFGFDANPSE